MKSIFSNEFKLECILSALQSGKTLIEVSAEKGISEVSLARWIRIYKANPETAFRVPVASESEKIDRKYATMASENEILKKAMAIMAKQFS